MPAGGEIKAKLVYYGPHGSGMTANLECIHRKLKKGHRGDLRTEGPPDARYEILPVQLGQIKGFTTSIHDYTVPGGDAHADTRQKLVRDADGIVFVADLRADRYNATLESLKELQNHLKSHGRSLREVLLVIQYNHRDEADENCVERLHKSIKLKPAASFEGIAPEGTGVLPCLTTISKLILADLRKRADREASSADAEPLTRSRLEDEIDVDPPSQREVEVRASIPAPKPSSDPNERFVVKSVGAAELSDNGIDIPIRLVHQRTGDALDLRIHLEIG
jgi:signal recognition particle receptor subunit beta